MKMHLIGCRVFTREIEDAIAKSPHRITTNFLPYQLHQKGGATMRQEIQAAIDVAPIENDAILLAYGLCNNGLVGVQARDEQLVAFRSHDCIACFLGSNKAYQDEVSACPGTYWLSIGWIENAHDYSEYMAVVPEKPSPTDARWLDLVAKYGEDNAEFLWEEQRKQMQHYVRMAYIDTGLGPQDAMADEARKRAVASRLRFERLTGQRSWIDDMVLGK